MNDDYQEARVLAEEEGSCTVEITYFPFSRPAIGENPNWRRDCANMLEYLRPTPAENWDCKMRSDLEAELLDAGIDVYALTDKQLVERVSQWALTRAHRVPTFGIWGVHFSDGDPMVLAPLKESFKVRTPDSTWTDEKIFHHEVLGRSMYYNKSHGSCTSSAVYMTTILRALGIPTRTVVCIPPFDPNEDSQSQMFYRGVRHHEVRETVRAAMDGINGFADHVFLEVYIGNRWTRLNYTRLGQPILDHRYLGLMTHVYTYSDYSESQLPATWGMRWFKYPDVVQPKLSSINPYRLLSVDDHFGEEANVPNPPVPCSELQSVTVDGIFSPTSTKLPQWVRDRLAKCDEEVDFLITCKEWVPGARLQLRAFFNRAGHDFIIAGPKLHSLKVRLTGLTLSSGDGNFQAFAATFLPGEKSRVADGVEYSLHPINTNRRYRWNVTPSVAPFFITSDGEIEHATLEEAQPHSEFGPLVTAP